MKGGGYGGGDWQMRRTSFVIGGGGWCEQAKSSGVHDRRTEKSEKEEGPDGDKRIAIIKALD